MRISDWSSDVCSSDLVDELQQMLGTVVHVAGIAYIARDVALAEQLAADDLGEPENRVERRPELVAHGGEELRLRHVRRLRLEPLLVDLPHQRRHLLCPRLEMGPRLLELGDDAVEAFLVFPQLLFLTLDRKSVV